MWRWTDVARWANDNLVEDAADVETGTFVAALNDALDLRRLSPDLEARDQMRQLVGLVR